MSHEVHELDIAPTFKSKANKKQYCFNETVKDNIQETKQP